MDPMRRCELCEAPLSRHNPDSVCGACKAARRGLRASTRFEAPVEALLRPEVVAALGDWQWKAALRAITIATGVTQTRISELTGLTQPTVSRLMNGQIKTPTIQTVRALCDGLGIPRDFAGLAPRGSTASLRAEEET